MLQITRILDTGKAVILASMTDPRNTRERLIKATIRVLEKEGESGVRIRDICKATNTAAPSVYYFFGDRNGLIRAAQASRYRMPMATVQQDFAEAVYLCRNKAEFTKLVHQILDVIYSDNRNTFQSTRVNVLGNAQSDRLLARELAAMHDRINKVSAEPIRFAQAKKWIDDDFNPQMFYAWLVGTLNGRTLIYLDGTHPDSDDWDFIAKRAVCRLFGIDEPKPTKKSRRNRKTK
jgi:AcrR family transcriptional regulator